MIMALKDPLQGYDQEEVILLGESHIENAHNALEEEAIYRTTPRMVLDEGLNDTEPHETEELLEKISPMNLEDINEFFGTNFEDSCFLAEDNEELFNRVSNGDYGSEICEGEIPETYNEFMCMPFSRMNRGIIDLINNSIRERKDYELEEKLKWTAEDSESIEDVKIESLRNIERDISSKYTLPDSTVSLAHPITNLRKEGYTVDLAGCDVNKKDRYFNLSGYELPDEAKDDLSSLDEDDSFVEFIEKMSAASQLADQEEITYRDQAMAERIYDSHDRNNSERPILAVIGAEHLEGVTQKLETNGVDVYRQNLSEIVETTDLHDGVAYSMDIADSYI